MEACLGSVVEAASVLARGVFDELDVQLEPRVVLVAVSVSDPEARPAIVRSAADADDGGLLGAELERVFSVDAASDAGVVDGDLEASRAAVVRAAAVSDAASGAVSFVSSARLLASQLVHVVLRVKRSAHDAYYALKRSRSLNGFPMARSLLEATISQYLNAAAAAVAESGAGADSPALMRSADEVVRAAARVLMRTPAIAAGNVAGADGFFQTCHRISTMLYEGREGSGQVIVAAPRHPNVFSEISLRTRIDLRDHRAARKVLEVTGDGLAVLSDSAHLQGLGRVVGAYERSTESLFEVTFRSHSAWDLSHAGSVLMTVADGYPALPHGELDEDEFRRLLADVFEPRHAVRYDRLWEIAMQATEQRRGTTVVVSAEAAAESARLGGQALGLVPVGLTAERVRTLTAIDGAVLVDLDGSCHAVGVILDGRASKRGDPARGARFNSAVRYVDASEHPCVAIVISEGGGVDVIRPLG